MKFSHGFRTILTAGLAATLLAGTVLAAPVTAVPISAELPSGEAQVEKLQSVCVYGKATEITLEKDGSRILLENSNDKDPNQKILVQVTDQTAILDAVTGSAKTMQDIKKNETLYAYVGPAVAMSMPPQASATLVLCNIPADFAVPKYAEVQSITAREDGGVDALMAPSVILHLNQDTQLLSYRTDNIVNLGDITVGTHLLSWYAAETRSMPGQATPTKVMVFPKTTDPASTITRGAFMELLYASAKSPATAEPAAFTDVDCAAVNWAAAQKIALGTGAAKFSPESPLTRQQMMMFLVRYATVLETGPVGAWATRITYTDLADIAPWATSGAMWNEISKLVIPDQANNILPTAKVTYAEATAAIKGLLAR